MKMKLEISEFELKLINKLVCDELSEWEKDLNNIDIRLRKDLIEKLRDLWIKNEELDV